MIPERVVPMREWLETNSTVEEMTKWGPAVVRALAALIDPLITDEGEDCDR